MCRIITPNVASWGFCLDDAQRGSAWENCVAERLVSHLQADSGTQVPIGLGKKGALRDRASDLVKRAQERLAAFPEDALLKDDLEHARGLHSLAQESGDGTVINGSQKLLQSERESWSALLDKLKTSGRPLYGAARNARFATATITDRVYAMEQSFHDVLCLLPADRGHRWYLELAKPDPGGGHPQTP